MCISKDSIEPLLVGAAFVGDQVRECDVGQARQWLKLPRNGRGGERLMAMGARRERFDRRRPEGARLPTRVRSPEGLGQGICEASDLRVRFNRAVRTSRTDRTFARGTL